MGVLFPIDPLRQRAEAATHSVSSTGLGSTPGRINPLPNVRLAEITAVLAAAPQFSPAQSKQIVALLRATLESFAAPVPAARTGGSHGALQAAVVSLVHLQDDLVARLTHHQDQARTLAPILHALMQSANADEPAEAAPRPATSFVPGAGRGPSPSTGPIGTSIGATTQPTATSTGPIRISTGATTQPTATPVPVSVTSLAQSLAEAVARLEEILSTSVLMLAQPAYETAPQDAPRVAVLPAPTADLPAHPGLPPARPDPPDAFRWLLDAALTLTTGPARPLPTQPEVVRLTSLAHALLDAFATQTPAIAELKTGTVGQGDLWVALDRYPRVAPLVAPILRELGLAAGNTQLAPAAVSAEVFAAAIARVPSLAVVVLAEAETVGAPVLYRQFLAACEAAGMPPFTVPIDSADNIETYRWLLIAAQLYNSRVAPRPPLQRCNRCGRILQRSRTGILICPTCP